VGPDPGDDAKPCLLVVDDEPENRDLLRRTLKRDFDVEDAEDASAALAVLGRRQVALMLCDQLMPGKSGTDLAADVRERWPGTRVVLLTGYDDDPEVAAAHADGRVAAVVGKPWQATRLRALIAALLAG
jgi:two-component system, NtrC family, response regulator HupR/HoxA